MEYKGGAWQLAQVFATRIQQEPDRFARLSLQFPSGTRIRCIWARTLASLKDASVEGDLKLQVCRKAFEESRGDYGRTIADVLGSIEDPLPNDAVAMLHWLATEHDDPAAELWQQATGGGRKHWNGEIDTAGINTTRGRAAIAVRDLILHDAAHVERFRITLDRMIRDPSTSVLSCVAGTLRAVAFRDPALGMSFFQDMNVPTTVCLRPAMSTNSFATGSETALLNYDQSWSACSGLPNRKFALPGHVYRALRS